MSKALSPDIANAAWSVRRTHPHAPALDVLELVFQGHRDAELDPKASWVRPGSPLGQVIAAAFDRGMPPEDWAAGTRPPSDPVVQETLATIWQSQILPAFAEHFGLRLVP